MSARIPCLLHAVGMCAMAVWMLDGSLLLDVSGDVVTSRSDAGWCPQMARGTLRPLRRGAPVACMHAISGGLPASPEIVVGIGPTDMESMHELGAHLTLPQWLTSSGRERKSRGHATCLGEHSAWVECRLWRCRNRTRLFNRTRHSPTCSEGISAVWSPFGRG